MKKRIMAAMLLAAVCSLSACSADGLFGKKKEYYECTVEFYVSPQKNEVDEEQDVEVETYDKYVLDNMAKLLSSEYFAEYLMLDGESVPKRGAWTLGKNDEDVSIDVNAGIDIATMEMEHINDIYFELSIEEEVAQTCYEELCEIWNKEVPNSGAESAYWKYSEEAYNELYQKGSLSVGLQAAHEDYVESKEAVESAKDRAQDAKEAAQEKIDEALALWRATNEYQSQFKQYSKGVTYSYQNVTDDNGVARSMLYAEISVLEDESFAARLLSRILSHLPSYVQDNMAIPQGYVGTYCKASTNFHEIGMVKK